MHVYDEGKGDFQMLKNSVHIQVPEEATVTFNSKKIYDGYERSLVFTTTQGYTEKWIYRSHGSSLYFTLSRTFDIKAIETMFEADEEDVDGEPFTASDYMLVHTLLKDLRKISIEVAACTPPTPQTPQTPPTPPTP